MAKKRHSKKGVHGVRRRRSSRRGMHGVTSGIVGTATDVLALGVGMIAAKYVSNKLLTSQNDMIKNAAPVVAGLALTTLVKNPMINSVGKGMILSPAVAWGTTQLGIGDLMADISPAETEIMENITVGAVEIGEDITVGAYGGESIYE